MDHNMKCLMVAGNCQTLKMGPKTAHNIDLSFLQVSYMDKIGQTGNMHHYLALLASVAANAPQVRQWMKKYSGKYS